ncbi:MAG: carboxymuconolactone decarboxylase family protein [Rhodobacteraceae bacterium]|nr:carboxymuconolactone decarboxylase family protein [Paracoccaceae bacterium]
MTKTRIHTVETAPDASKPLLSQALKSTGRIANLHGVMAESPALLEGYQTLHRLALDKTGFSPAERTVIWQSINVEHACHYCVPAHTAIAESEKVDADVTEALRDEQPLNDPRLEALRAFTLAVVRKRAQLSPGDEQAFRQAGYDDRAILDVIAIVAQKVMSNYTNAIFGTPVDAPFQKFAWGAGRKAA